MRGLRRDPLDGPDADGRGLDGPWQEAPSVARPLFPDLGPRKASHLVMIEWRCPRCVQVISADDTVQLVGEGMSHVDCRRPRDLSPEERALLFRYDPDALGADAAPR